MTKRLETRSFESPDSTNVKRVEWTGEPAGHGVEGAGELRVYFVNGSAYGYEGVPVEIFNHLRTAESVGGVFHEVVRKPGKYKPTQLTEPTLKREPKNSVEAMAARDATVHYDGLTRGRAACGAGGVRLSMDLDDVTCHACCATLPAGLR